MLSDQFEDNAEKLNEEMQGAVGMLFDVVKRAAKIYVEESNKLQQVTIDTITKHYGIPKHIVERVWEEVMQDLVIENLDKLFAQTGTDFNKQAL